MKKILIALIIIFALFIPLAVSCTQDASEGIFAQVVTQGSSAKYKIKQFIHYDSSGKDYYFLEVGGVYKNSECIIPGSFSEAFYESSSKNLYLLDINGNIKKYRLNNPNSVLETKPGFAKLTPNGYALEAHNSNITNLYKVSDSYTSYTNLPKDVIRMLWAGDTVLLQTNKNDDYDGISTFILSRTEFKKITVNSTKKVQIIGFQSTSSTDKFYILTCDENSNYEYYKISKNDTEYVCSFLDEASTPAYNVTQAPSYYDSVNNVAVFRCASYYDEINASDDKVTSGISGGFASSIHTDTMEVVSMVPVNDDKGSAVIAFYKYGLYKANVNNSPSTEEIKF